MYHTSTIIVKGPVSLNNFRVSKISHKISKKIIELIINSEGKLESSIHARRNFGTYILIISGTIIVAPFLVIVSREPREPRATYFFCGV